LYRKRERLFKAAVDELLDEFPGLIKKGKTFFGVRLLVVKEV